MRYFITFTCYGARLHGDEAGSVDRHHQLPGGRFVEPDGQRVMAAKRRMLQDPYELDAARRAVVLEAIRNHCTHRGWNLLAAHVRSNHVHSIVEAEARPEKIMNEFKSYASRELNRVTGERAERRRWTRHGSTLWLWKDEDVRRALLYMIEDQGEPISLFIAAEM